MSYLTQRLGFTRYEADEYYAQALDDYAKNKLNEAIDNIGFAITLLPQNAEYHAARGLFYLEDGVDKQAKENFERALQLHPLEVAANYGMGVVAFNAREWTEAIEWFQKARTVDPTQVEVPYYIALAYHRQQQNETAITYMQQALQMMEAAEDKRRTQAKRWLREFEKLVKQRTDLPTQNELPIRGAASGISVTRQEIEASRTAGELSAGDDDAPDEAAETDEDG